MSGWFELTRNDKGQFHFVLKAGNAETILSSEVYQSKASAENGIASVGHNGGQQGTSTAFTIAPAQRAGVVVLTNMEGADASKLAQEVLRVLVGSTEMKK